MNSPQKPLETQQDLFGGNTGAPQRPERFPGISKSHKPILFSTSAEHLIFLGILTVLAASFAFYLGILRGKNIARISQTSPAASVARPPVRAAVQLPQPSAAVSYAEPSAVAAAGEAKTTIKDKPYTIQLASFKKKDWADADASALRRMGYSATVARSADYYVVLVGQYAGKDDAKKDIRSLSSRYKDLYLRRR